MDKKRELYNFIEGLKSQHSHALSYMTIREFCEIEMGIIVAEMVFKTDGLRGMAQHAHGREPAVIILSEKRNEKEQNFDCAHELIHLVKHPASKASAFRCYDKVRPKQNQFHEWEANEGAAEFLIPYKEFLPALVDKIAYIEDDVVYVIPEDVWELAERFQVTDAMITNRIQNLYYELRQYLSGVSLDTLDIRSRNAQKKAHIDYSKFSVQPCYNVRVFENTYELYA
jgi:Zn-dependent peptidase ImmA (M78 family)